MVFSSYIYGVSYLVPSCISKRGRDFNIRGGGGGGEFLFNFPEMLLTNGPIPANFLSNRLTTVVSNFRVNRLVFLSKFTSQILISAFADIMSAKLFLKFFPVLNILPDFLVINLFIRY